MDRQEFQPSTLSKDEQMKEMEWFIKAAAPLKGMEIKVVSETITTHEYESKVLAKAFYEITGIKVTHDLIQEGDVVEKLQTQMQSGENVYDGYVNDSDLIGTHFRYQRRGQPDRLDGRRGQGRDPAPLDIDDFIGKSFTTGPDGKLYQLPDQQFANLYWFRYDWFKKPDLKAKFKAKYGYELGVPVNWSAYEDIAEFFTNDVKEIDGKAIYGHMDYGKKAPDLGWRFTDAWLSMAGNGDKGIPNGLPVDEWGIRMDGCRPVGSSVARGGDTNGPAGLRHRQVHRLAAKYAPPEAQGMTSTSPCRCRPGQRRPADLLVHRLHRRHGRSRRDCPWSTTTARRSGAWLPRRTGPYWKEGRSSATRTPVPGRC
jgi:glycerol transport system substrate-binding protein